VARDGDDLLFRVAACGEVIRTPARGGQSRSALPGPSPARPPGLHPRPAGHARERPAGGMPGL